MGKKRRLNKFPEKFGRKHAAHPITKLTLQELETVTKDEVLEVPSVIKEVKPKKKVTGRGKKTKLQKRKPSASKKNKKKTASKKD